MNDVIDIHAHSVPKGWPDLAEATGRPGPWPQLRVDSETEAMIMLDGKEWRPLTDTAWSAETRLGDMDADGVDKQVVSPTPLFFTYAEDGKTSATIARIFNDLALETAAAGGDRLIPFCQVPLQDTDEALAELERCMDAGHRGVEIGNHVGDRDLDDAGVVDFLTACAEKDVPVFVHPWDMPTSPRLERWMSRWLVGMPAETHLSIISLILGGAFDRLPTNLKLCFAHSGGSFCYWLGRFENAWHRRSDIIATSEQPPSAYVDRFSVDCVVFHEPALRLLVDVMGADRVMLGSDYPYPLGERPAGGLIRTASFLDDAQRQAMLSGNAHRFLNLQNG